MGKQRINHVEDNLNYIIDIELYIDKLLKRKNPNYLILAKTKDKFGNFGEDIATLYLTSK